MSKASELRGKLRVTKFPDDIIKAIIMLMENTHFSKDPGKIHRAIYRLKMKNAKYRELLSDFVFDLSGIEPYSELLDRVIFRLETSSILGTLNPRYEEYKVERSQNFEEELNNKFNSAEKSILKNISKDFEKMLIN